MTEIFDPQYVDVAVDPKLWHSNLDTDLKLPLFEDEDGNGVYGYGHIPPRLFAAMVNLYDVYLTGGTEYELYTEEDVYYHMAIAHKREDMLDEDYFRFTYRDTDAKNPLAFPVTVIER